MFAWIRHPESQEETTPCNDGTVANDNGGGNDGDAAASHEPESPTEEAGPVAPADNGDDSSVDVNYQRKRTGNSGSDGRDTKPGDESSKQRVRSNPKSILKAPAIADKQLQRETKIRGWYTNSHKSSTSLSSSVPVANNEGVVVSEVTPQPHSTERCLSASTELSLPAGGLTKRSSPASEDPEAVATQHKTAESVALTSVLTSGESLGGALHYSSPLDSSQRREKRAAVKSFIEPKRKKFARTTPSLQPKRSTPEKEPRKKKNTNAKTAVSPSLGKREKKSTDAETMDGAGQRDVGSIARNTPKRARFTAAKEIWSGQPDDKIEGGWPRGWTKKTFQRQSGKTAGTTDSYWYTPLLQKKLRSMIEVRRFMEALKKHGSEEEAWKVCKRT